MIGIDNVRIVGVNDVGFVVSFEVVGLGIGGVLYWNFFGDYN